MPEMTRWLKPVLNYGPEETKGVVQLGAIFTVFSWFFGLFRVFD